MFKSQKRQQIELVIRFCNCTLRQQRIEYSFQLKQYVCLCMLFSRDSLLLFCVFNFSSNIFVVFSLSSQFPSHFCWFVFFLKVFFWNFSSSAWQFWVLQIRIRSILLLKSLFIAFFCDSFMNFNEFLFLNSRVNSRGIVELGDVTPHNIKLLRRLNQVVFPVSYNEKFYKDVLESGQLAKLGMFSHLDKLFQP